MFILALGDLPRSWYSVAVLPVSLAILGVTIWIAGRTSEVKHSAWPWKWIAVPLFLIALVVGVAPCLRMRDFLYRDAIEPFGKKMAIAHYGAFLVPILLIAAVAAWEMIERRQVDEEY